MMEITSELHRRVHTVHNAFVWIDRLICFLYVSVLCIPRGETESALSEYIVLQGISLLHCYGPNLQPLHVPVNVDEGTYIFCKEGSQLNLKCKCQFNIKYRECLCNHLSERLMIKCLTIIQIEFKFSNVGF